MLTKRIIPCLDVKDGRTVKGTNFVNLRDAGDPVDLGEIYALRGADELVFLDITATVEKRKTLSEMVRRIAHRINIPFTVGGGVSDIRDVEMLLNSGADKITINSAAFKRPSLISDLARNFGSQCVVLAIDTKKESDGVWWVYLQGGRIRANETCITWARRGVDLGAGEILVTSMDHDGTKHGFALDITRTLSTELPVPVIASGGAGQMNHFTDVFQIAKADAALAASIFHFGEIEIRALKTYLKERSINVRI
ncbi:MAG TPA: imidazole glycerol phosphate synthase subunit HisF [Puia sp.]|nr:imidazole glycerol phosphate synthase subunit HisF [Puia sp.]